MVETWFHKLCSRKRLYVVSSEFDRILIHNSDRGPKMKYLLQITQGFRT